MKGTWICRFKGVFRDVAPVVAVLALSGLIGGCAVERARLGELLCEAGEEPLSSKLSESSSSNPPPASDPAAP